MLILTKVEMRALMSCQQELQKVIKENADILEAVFKAHDITKVPENIKLDGNTITWEDK